MVDYSQTFFPTASNCSVFINGHHIDLAYKFDFRESTQRLPIFGYNDYNFDRAVKGRNMIQLSLVINFVHPNYLSYVFDAGFNDKLIGPTQSPTEDVIEKDFFRYNLYQDTSEEGGKASRAAYIAKILDDKKNKQRLKNDIYKITELSDLAKSTVYESPANHPTFTHNKSTIDLYYTDPTLSIYRVSFLDVSIFDISQEISQMGMDGSSSPLFEIYQMYASKREIRTIRK